MADAEPVDPKNHLEERCKPQCVKSLFDYERCIKRVENDESGQKHCTGQYFDYWSCVDKCMCQVPMTRNSHKEGVMDLGLGCGDHCEGINVCWPVQAELLPA